MGDGIGSFARMLMTFLVCKSGSKFVDHLSFLGNDVQFEVSVLNEVYEVNILNVF